MEYLQTRTRSERCSNSIYLSPSLTKRPTRLITLSVRAIFAFKRGPMMQLLELTIQVSGLFYSTIQPAE